MSSRVDCRPPKIDPLLARAERSTHDDHAMDAGIQNHLIALAPIHGHRDDIEGSDEDTGRGRRLFLQQAIDAEFSHRIGQPADAIATVAREGEFDLVLVGSQGHGALANLLLGSVATKVLAQCATPTLLVR